MKNVKDQILNCKTTSELNALNLDTNMIDVVILEGEVFQERFVIDAFGKKEDDGLHSGTTKCGKVFSYDSNVVDDNGTAIITVYSEKD